MIKEAEANHARMIATPGNGQNINVLVQSPPVEGIVEPLMVHQQATLVDENYFVIGSHIDLALKVCIINHEYIDFA